MLNLIKYNKIKYNRTDYVQELYGFIILCDHWDKTGVKTDAN